MLTNRSWDVFVSHASEDKDAVARPLARRLQHEPACDLGLGDPARPAERPHLRHYVESLLSALTPESRRQMASGSVSDWAWETHRVAVDVVDPPIPPAGGLSLGDEYLTGYAHGIAGQLQRLACALPMFSTRFWTRA
jgi:hypothetical protein